MSRVDGPNNHRDGTVSATKIYTHLSRPLQIGRVGLWWHLLKGIFLSPAYYLAAMRYDVPGLWFHRWAFGLGLRLLLNRRRSLPFGLTYHLLFSPLDSVRYFELDYLWKAISSQTSLGNYLDVSSPRLFPISLLDFGLTYSADLLNPDAKDLTLTRKILQQCGLESRCRFHNKLINSVDFKAASFDTISSISVIEHIPEDSAALEKLWDLLKPNGRLFISVPCAARAIEEYIDYDEYGVLEADNAGYVFGQRLYDESLLESRIFRITGSPVRHTIYGETMAGILLADRDHKMREPRYPFWNQPMMMARQFRYYHSVAELPGWGVIAMEFRKD